MQSCAVRSSADCTAKATCVVPRSGGDDGAAVSGEDGASLLDVATDGAGDAAGLDATGDGGADSPALGAADGSHNDAQDQDVTADGANEAGGLDAGVDSGGDGAADSGRDAAGLDGAADSGRDAAGLDGAADSGSIAVGLVAFYPFDEAGGTTSADVSGNGHTAILNGATFAAGLRGNAATMNGSTQYVSLPAGIVSGLSSFSISAWVYLNNSMPHFRIFDFGTSTTTYMFLTASDQNPPNARFTITTSAVAGEQKVAGPPLAVNSWQHVAVSLTGTMAILYVNGVQVAQNPNMTLNPASLGTTTQNWIGRSQFAADPYLNGQIDNFRIYNRALSAAEVQQLYQQQL